MCRLCAHQHFAIVNAIEVCDSIHDALLFRENGRIQSVRRTREAVMEHTMLEMSDANGRCSLTWRERVSTATILCSNARKWKRTNLVAELGKALHGVGGGGRGRSVIVVGSGDCREASGELGGAGGHGGSSGETTKRFWEGRVLVYIEWYDALASRTGRREANDVKKRTQKALWISAGWEREGALPGQRVSLNSGSRRRTRPPCA